MYLSAEHARSSPFYVRENCVLGQARGPDPTPKKGELSNRRANAHHPIRAKTIFSAHLHYLQGPENDSDAKEWVTPTGVRGRPMMRLFVWRQQQGECDE